MEVNIEDTTDNISYSPIAYFSNYTFFKGKVQGKLFIKIPSTIEDMVAYYDISEGTIKYGDPDNCFGSAVSELNITYKV